MKYSPLFAWFLFTGMSATPPNIISLKEYCTKKADECNCTLDEIKQKMQDHTILEELISSFEKTPYANLNDLNYRMLKDILIREKAAAAQKPKSLCCKLFSCCTKK